MKNLIFRQENIFLILSFIDFYWIFNADSSGSKKEYIESDSRTRKKFRRDTCEPKGWTRASSSFEDNRECTKVKLEEFINLLSFIGFLTLTFSGIKERKDKIDCRKLKSFDWDINSTRFT